MNNDTNNSVVNNMNNDTNNNVVNNIENTTNDTVVNNTTDENIKELLEKIQKIKRINLV